MQLTSPVSDPRGYSINLRPLMQNALCRFGRKKAPPARGIWPKHFVPAAPHFDANVWQPCRFKIWGRGGRRKKWAREGGNAIEELLCEALTQIPNVLRAENKNSMGAAPATLALSIKAPSATQKPWGASPEGSDPTSPYATPTSTPTTQPIPVLAREPPTSPTHLPTSPVVGGAVKRVTVAPTGSSPLIGAGVHSGMWLGLGNFTVD